MSFLQKVEAAAIKADIQVSFKPVKINQQQPKSKKARAPKVDPKFAKGASGERVNFTDLTNTRKLISFIKKELQLTDPFNFTNDTWARFTKRVAPKLLTALLLDMQVVPKEKKAEFARYLDRRLRTLTKT